MSLQWLMFFVATVICPLLCSSCDPVHQSYQLCAGDAACHYHLSIDQNGDDYIAFQNQHDWVVNKIKAHGYVDDLLCSNETSGHHLWVHTLTHHAKTYCYHINEYYDPEIGCVCRSDKSCHTKHPTEFGFTHNRLLAWSLLLSVVAVYIISWHRIKELYKIIHDQPLISIATSTSLTPQISTIIKQPLQTTRHWFTKASTP